MLVPLQKQRWLVKDWTREVWRCAALSRTKMLAARSLKGWSWSLHENVTSSSIAPYSRAVSILSYWSSSVGSHHPGRPSLHKCIGSPLFLGHNVIPDLYVWLTISVIPWNFSWCINAGKLNQCWWHLTIKAWVCSCWQFLSFKVSVKKQSRYWLLKEAKCTVYIYIYI